MESELMSAWDDYKRVEQDKPERQPLGKTRCVIVDVEETVSKSSGNPMIVVTCKPSGHNAKLKYYIVKNDKFNKNMTDFFDAVDGVEDGDFNFLSWIGCEIGADIGLDDDGFWKIKWWLDRRWLGKLPPFEGEKPQKMTVTKLDDPDTDLEEDLPWV